MKSKTVSLLVLLLVLCAFGLAHKALAGKGYGPADEITHQANVNAVNAMLLKQNSSPEPVQSSNPNNNNR